MQQIPEYSLSELSGKIKALIEGSFMKIRVRGEVSGFKLASSGHAYFNLKDDKVILTCTCWRPVIMKFRDQIRDGVEIIATGKVTTYAGQSRYQLSVEHIAPAGKGAWMQLFNELKSKLQQEGLFADHYKKKLPLLPRSIALVTSGTGSVLHDMVHRIKDRCPMQLFIYPVAVQGEGAAQQVQNAVIDINKELSNKVDVIIIARGGGSIEDLWCFNDEELARVVFSSQIPVISAIGHETDFTILDFVADQRAPTPSAAAEIAVPSISALRDKLRNVTSFLANVVRNQVQRDDHRLLKISSALRGEFLSSFVQTIDEYELLLNKSIDKVVVEKHHKYASATIRPAVIKNKVENLSVSLRDKGRHLFNAVARYEQGQVMKLDNYSRILDSMDHKRVLQRGFALVKSKDGSVITRCVDAKNSQDVTLNFADGPINAKVSGS